MYTLPDALAAALASARNEGVARLIARWPDGSLRRTWELDTTIVLDGGVEYDLAADVRRRANLTLANTTGALSPVAIDDVFAEGSWLELQRGARVAGSPIVVPLINGFVTDCQPAMGGTIALVIESFMSALAQPAGTALVLTAGTYLGDALRTLWAAILPYVTWVVDDAGRALGSDIPVLPDDDLLTVGLTLARDSGLEAFDDRLGRLVVRPRQDPTTMATARVFSTPLTLSRQVRRRPYNAQPFEATPGDAEPIFVVARVDDPASPIHPDRIGLRMAPVMRSDSAADPDTALAAARAMLAMRALSQDGVSTEEVPVLDIDEGDIGEWSERISGTTGRYRVDRISIPAVLGRSTISATKVIPLWAA